MVFKFSWKKDDEDDEVKKEERSNKRFEIEIEFKGEKKKLIGKKLGYSYSYYSGYSSYYSYSYYYGYSGYSYYSGYRDEEEDSKVDVDLRDIVDDMSKEPTEYIEGAVEVIKNLMKKDEVSFGCSAGCGRTFTVLLLVLSAVYGDKEKVIEKYEEALKQSSDSCPETEQQFKIAGAAVKWADGKPPLESAENFSRWVGGIVAVGKGWIKDEEAGKIAEELKQIAKKYDKWFGSDEADNKKKGKKKKKKD